MLPTADKLKVLQMSQVNKFLQSKVESDWERILTKSQFIPEEGQDFTLKDINIYHVNNKTKGALKNTKYAGLGFTVVIYTTPSGSFYSFTECMKEEAYFDRRIGVNQAFKKALKLGVLSFAQLGVKEDKLREIEANSKGAITFNQLFIKTLGYYLFNASLPPKPAKQVPLTSGQCNTIVAALLNSFIPALQQPGIEVQVQYSQVRAAQDSNGVCGFATMSYLQKQHEGVTYQLNSKLGLTLFIVTLTQVETGAQIVYTSFAQCSKKDVFNKAMGRLVATRQFAKNNVYELHIPKGEDAFKETINFYSNLFGQNIAS